MITKMIAMISFIIVCTAVLTLCLGCKAKQQPKKDRRDEIYKLVEDYVKSTTTDNERDKMKLTFDEVLKDWSENATSMGIYKKYSYSISDIVIFNREKDKVLLFTSFINDAGHGSVDMHGGRWNQKDNVWQFHHSGLPGFSYRYVEEYRDGVQFTSHELLARSIEKLADDGLLRNKKVHNKYISTKWF